MSEATIQINDCTDKVEKCEIFVDSLEKEIVEWDALQKLVRRDTDLTNIERGVDDTMKDLNAEFEAMNVQLEKKTKDDQDEKIYEQVETLNLYIADIG